MLKCTFQFKILNYICKKKNSVKMNKSLKLSLLLKDATINKVQFDKEWFFHLKDMSDYLGEDLSEVEAIHLPFTIDEETVEAKCATLEDIERGRKER